MSAKTFALVLTVVAVSAVLLEARSQRPKCSICKGISEKFLEGLKTTAKSNFGGGNTRWEEKSLGSYQFSETRLIEITEQLCSESDCYSFMEEWEEAMETWWFKLFARGRDQDFYQYFCIDLTKVCCPKNTHGPNCEPCPGGTERPCKGNGRCEGEGTRDGAGKCECDEGYEGELCDECKEGYFEEHSNDTHITCQVCHEACDGGCHKDGPDGCHDCKKGWRLDLNDACQDIDECAEDEDNSICEKSRFCRNSPGSYECEGCDSACESCTGFGPSNCTECKANYFKDGDTCKACNHACKSSCTGPGPKDCEECKEGFVLHEESGCKDVNECNAETPPCSVDEYCSNSYGSYHCAKCDRTCAGCTGLGATLCKECAKGYSKNEDSKACEDIDECMSEEKMCQGNHEKCVNTVGGYDCVCMKGYIRKGDKCERRYKGAVTYSKPSCDICKDIVKNIKKGIEKTDKQNFGGGNTQWEEKKLGVYASSETRLVEITEDVCGEYDKDCSRMMELNEKFVEQWWFNHFTKQKDTDLHTYFCVERAEACCHEGTYGPTCKECPGGKQQPCSGQGSCNGDGTREGTGKCDCEAGYTGDQCSECASGYFEDRSSKKDTICHKCHESCDDTCTEAGPKGCDSCHSGWEEKEGEGCVDIDECASKDPRCKDNEFCSNTVGSFSCEACSSSCSGCTGPGNDKCVKCAANHFFEEGKCIECHSSCEGCTGGGAHQCEKCSSGWQRQEDGTCIDVNECDSEQPTCKPDQYCINNLGSYRCHNCHKACAGCSGPGVDKCTECAEGYGKQGTEGSTKCGDIDECVTGTVCLTEGEICINTVGSYKCDCDEKYTKKDGKCIKKKAVKKPKKKKKKKKKEEDKAPEESLREKAERELGDHVTMIDGGRSPEETAKQVIDIINKKEEL